MSLLTTHSQLQGPSALVSLSMVFTDINIDIVIFYLGGNLIYPASDDDTVGLFTLI